MLVRSIQLEIKKLKKERLIQIARLGWRITIATVVISIAMVFLEDRIDSQLHDIVLWILLATMVLAILTSTVALELVGRKGSKEKPEQE